MRILFYAMAFAALIDKLRTVDAKQQQKQGNKQRAKHKSNKTKELYTYQYAKHGNERVNVANSFVQNKTE